METQTETIAPTPTVSPTPASTSKIKLCVICCAGFNSASTIQRDAILCREHLVSFCKLLANLPPRQNPEFDALLQKSFPGMDAFFEKSGMSVCVDCHHQITVAMERSAEAEKKKEQVRQLQLQILQQMKELQKQVDEFHEEMTKVKKTIQTSNVSCLMYHMAKNPSKNDDATNGIVLIRDRILDVMGDLRDFQVRQKTALDFNLETILNISAVVTGDAVPVTEGDDDDFIPFIRAPDVIIGTEGLLEAARSLGVAPMFFGHTIFGNDGDFRFETGTKNNGVQEGDSDISKSDAESDSSDSEISIHSDASLERMERKRLTYGGKIPVTLNPSKMVTAITAASSDPAVGVPTVPAPQFLKHLTTPGPIGPLKKEIIDRCERQCRSKQDDLSVDPLVRYPLQYDPATDKLSINGFEIIVDESRRVLKCGRCGFARREYKRVGSLDIEWKLKAHIMTAHVGFICTALGCNFKCQNHHQFLRHLRSGKHGIQSSPPQTNSSVQSKPSAVLTRNSPRQAPPPPTPYKIKQEKPKPSTSTSFPTPTTNNGRSRSKIRMLQGDARVSATTVRTCPVSNCGKTFAKKEDFIRHLQGHRNQNKWRRERQKMRMEKKNEEPEIVTLD